MIVRTLALLLVLSSLVLGQASIVHNGNNNIIHAGLRVQYKFTEGSGQYILNRVVNSAAPAAPNLFSTGEQWATQPGFGINSWNQGGTMTLTDFFATDPNSTPNSATRGQFGAGALLSQSIPLPAATYTASIYVKSNTGSTQAMRIFTGSFSADKSVTTSWTRITQTFTLGSPGSVTVGFTTDVAADPMDILIYGAVLNTGSSAIDYAVPSFDQQLGKQPIADSNDPSWVSTGIDTSAGSTYTYGISNTPISITSSFSIYAVIKKTGSSLASGQEPVFAENYGTLKLIFGTALSGFNNVAAKVPVFLLGGQSAHAFGVPTLNDGKWHILTGTYDGTTLKVFLDSVLVGYKTAAITAPTIRQIYISELAGQSISASYFPGLISAGLIYETYHDQTKVSRTFTVLANDAARRGITITRPTKFITFDGDSLTDPLAAPGVSPPTGPGIYTNGWAYNFLQNLGETVLASNFALSGSTIVPGSLSLTNASRYSLVDATCDPTRTKDVYVEWTGANDGNSGVSAASYVSQTKTYLMARKAACANRKIAVLAVLPQTTAHVGFNTWRNSVNALIAADPDFTNGVAADFFVRIDLESHIGPDAAAMDAALYYDGEHLTAAGLGYLWPVAVSAVSSYMP